MNMCILYTFFLNYEKKLIYKYFLYPF